VSETPHKDEWKALAKWLEAENERLKAENARLRRLAQEQQPTLETRRRVEVLSRTFAQETERLAEKMRELHEAASTLVPADHCDLPSLTEMFGILAEKPAEPTDV
jgi:hypothetical protein